MYFIILCNNCRHYGDVYNKQQHLQGFSILVLFLNNYMSGFSMILKFSFLCQASPSGKKKPSKDKQTQQHFKTLNR